MFTDAPSRARSLASATGSVREFLSSTAAQRGFIVLSFFLYEVPFIRRLTSGQQWLPLPLWDVAVVDDPRTFVLLEAVYLCASVLACFPRFVVPGCFLAGSASILLVGLDLTYRLQFAFLPGGALFAIGLTEILARKADPKRRIDLPLVLFLGSIYCFASFHKLLNFHWMKTLVPSSVFSAPGGPAPAFCANADTLFLNLIVWTVVPYEALLGVLTLTRRWLKLRLACVCLFHWLLVALVPYIWHVSIYMVCLHLYLASLQRPSARQRMLVDRNWSVLVGAESLFVGAKFMAASIPGPAGIVLGAVAFANMAFFPLLFLLWPFWSAEGGPVVAPSPRLHGFTGVGVNAFGVLLLTFGFSPFLLEKHYSVLSLGWAMFAGGEYRDGSYYSLRTPSSPCFMYPVIHGMIWCQANDRQTVYLSFRRCDLERLKRYFERRRKCGGPPLQVETARF
jgi:hypothetical protein